MEGFPVVSTQFADTTPGSMPRRAGWAAGALLVIAVWWLGGWPWALLWALAFVVLARREGPVSALLAAGPTLFWLMVSNWTGDRRLFFPFALQLGQLSWPLPLLAVFFAVRVQQSASLHVLAVEFLVAAAALGAGRAIGGPGPTELRMRMVSAAVVSLLALIGLLL